MNREPELLSVVAPMYEEEDTVAPFIERVAAALGDLHYELILVNDGSKDRTRDAMAKAVEADARVKLIALSRNFGHQPAITAGIHQAAGDAIVILLDGDMQDPAGAHPQLVAKWHEGFQVVLALLSGP